MVTDDAILGDRDWIAECQAAVRGGVTAVQVRHTSASAREVAALTRALMAALPVPLFVNDRLDVALAVGAAGVHLGIDDVPVTLARRIAPEGFFVGASVGQADEVAGGAGADYWGVGPYRMSSTKDAGAALGIDRFAELVQMANATPCVAIGGVLPDDVAALASAGAVGVAVVSGILSSGDVTAAAARYARAWREIGG